MDGLIKVAENKCIPNFPFLQELKNMLLIQAF